jgi:hypothetical protein
MISSSLTVIVLPVSSSLSTLPGGLLAQMTTPHQPLVLLHSIICLPTILIAGSNITPLAPLHEAAKGATWIPHPSYGSPINVNHAIGISLNAMTAPITLTLIGLS